MSEKSGKAKSVKAKQKGENSSGTLLFLFCAGVIFGFCGENFQTASFSRDLAQFFESAKRNSGIIEVGVVWVHDLCGSGVGLDELVGGVSGLSGGEGGHGYDYGLVFSGLEHLGEGETYGAGIVEDEFAVVGGAVISVDLGDVAGELVILLELVERDRLDGVVKIFTHV